MIKKISLKKIHNKLKRKLDKFLKAPVDSCSKEQLNELFQLVEDIGFIKGLAMASFDNPSNILKKIKELENKDIIMIEYPSGEGMEIDKEDLKEFLKKYYEDKF